MIIHRGLPRLAAVALLLGLGGCITVFPKAQPVQMYRFGGAVQPPAAAGGPSVTVREDSLDFDRPAATDQMLAITGNEVAYVAGGRWAAPAPLLFDAAVARGFDAPGGAVRLLGAGDPGKAQYLLKLDVSRFEARYDNGQGAAPTVVVRLHATLDRVSDGAMVGDQVFDASVPASENRIGSIADAFDSATGKVIGDMVGWVDQAR